MKTTAIGQSLHRRIFRAGLAVGIAHLLFKFAGLIQASVMGRRLDNATYDSVYAFAFENCIFALFLIGEEVIGPSFLPVFLRECGNDGEGEKSAFDFARAFLTIQTVILLVAVGLLMAFPSQIVSFFTKWSDERKPEAFALAVLSVRNLAPALIGLSLGSTTYVLLNAYKRFFLAAFGDAVWKFTVVVALVAFAASSSTDMAMVLVWGLVAGSLLKLGAHLIGLRDKLGLFRPSFRWNDPRLKAMALLAAPLLAGIIFAKIRDYINNVYILSAMEEDGLMKANSMGRKLQGVIHWIIPYTLSIAVFPFFCEMTVRGDKKRLGSFITSSGRQLLALFLPFSALVAVLAHPLTELVFGGGNFDSVAVERTAVSMACYTFVLPAAAIEAIIMQAFFASRRTLAVSLTGIVFSALSIAISFVGAHFCRNDGLLFLGVVALGFTISRWLKSVTLVWLFRRSAPVFPVVPTLVFLLRLIIASCVTAVCAYFVRMTVGEMLCRCMASARLSCAVELLAGGTGGVVAALCALKVLGVGEPFELIRLVRRRRRG